MENTSPFLAMQRVEGNIKALLRNIDIGQLGQAEKKNVTNLRRLAVDCRLDIRDYELSETREDQLRCAKTAKKQLTKLREAILAVGSLFGPADVAQITAQLEQIENWVR